MAKDSICKLCGKPWNSEYHINDVCVNLNEDDWFGEKLEEDN